MTELNLIAPFPTPMPTIPVTLYAWGSAGSGKLGDDTTVSKSSPVMIGTYSVFKTVPSNAWSTTGFIQDDRTVIAWGNNADGQLGDGTTVSKSSPVQLPLTNVHDIRFGPSIMCKTGGTLWTWGRNAFGALGHDDLVNRSSPTQIPLVGLKVSAVANHVNNTGWVTTTGLAYAAGKNKFGQFAVNNTVNTSSYVQCGVTTVKYMAISANSMYWLRYDKLLYAAGCNNAGQLAQGDWVDRSVATQIVGLWNHISVGNENMAGIKEDGTLWTWGLNNLGQCGQGFASNNLNVPQQIEGTWLGVEISVATTIALKDDGTVWGWGLNARGELGVDNVISYSSPVQIGAGMGFWSRVQKCNQTSYGWLL